ncbi:MAG TPA: hypothetical protein VG269_16820 [Tepidisphaeraceae bacterium]|jgi:hypothetical protein|nr:hypothetical protein [Tepidisphaeraceae bacterium]
MPSLPLPAVFLRAANRAFSTIRPRRRRVVQLIAASLALLCGLNGSHPDHRAAAAPPKTPKAWFDAKGAAVFPLGPGALPVTREDLVTSLTKAWKEKIRFPEGGEIVQVEGGRYPALGSLKINLAGGIFDPDRTREDRSPGLRPSGKVESRVAARDFAFDCQPLICEKAKLNVHVAATDARLDVEHDNLGRPMLMLAGAKQATLDFEATRADLESLLLLGARENGGKYGVTVENIRLSIQTPSARTIDVDVRVSTKVGFIPADMRFQAHVDIDDHMNAKVSHLQCTGDKALGPLITGLIRPGLAKYEGKTRPLFSFPSDELKLRDARVEGGDDIRVKATFGG